MTDYEIDDRDFDRLIYGPPDASELQNDDTVQFIRDLRDMCVADQPGPHQQRHLDAIRRALTEPENNPTTMGAGTAAALPAAVSARSARRFLSDTMGTVAARAAAVATTLAVSTGGMAAAGVLPAPVQAVVAQAAESVGIDLPRPDPARIAGDADSEAGTSLTAGRPAGGSTVTADEVMSASQDVIGAAESTRKLVDDAVAAAQQCTVEVSAALEALAAQVPALAGQAQAQALVLQAQALQERASGCAAETAQAGRSGAEQAAAATAQADRLSASIAALPGLAEPAAAAATAARQAAATAAGSARQAIGMADALSTQVGELAAGVIGSARGLTPDGTAPVVRSSLPPAAPAARPTGLPVPAEQVPAPDAVPGPGTVERILGDLFGSNR